MPAAWCLMHGAAAVCRSNYAARSFAACNSALDTRQAIHANLPVILH